MAVFFIAVFWEYGVPRNEKIKNSNNEVDLGKPSFEFK